MSLRILQIVPRLPPAVCGIGDYSWHLAEALRAHHDVHSQFLVAGTNGAVARRELAFPAQRLLPLSSAAFRTAVARADVDAIVLHVSTYGYQKRGVPMWMARGVESLGSGTRKLPLIAVFHELYAGGSPRTSAFWLQPLQKYVLRRLVRAADRLRTNRQGYAEWIDAVAAGGVPETAVLPVFSNLGELERPPPLAQRPPAMIMFASGIHGGDDARAAVLRGVDLCRRFDLQALHVLGLSLADQEVADVQVRYRQFLPAREAAALFSQCRMGYTTYLATHLAKSGVFAAYAAHGLAVVAETAYADLPDGLRINHEVISEKALAAEPMPKPAELQAIADRLHLWYCGHSIAETAAAFAQDIRSCL